MCTPLTPVCRIHRPVQRLGQERRPRSYSQNNGGDIPEKREGSPKERDPEETPTVETYRGWMKREGKW